MSDMAARISILLTSYIVSYCHNIEKKGLSISYYNEDVPEFVTAFNNNDISEALESIASLISSKSWHPAEHEKEINFLKFIEQHMVKLLIELSHEQLLAKTKIIQDFIMDHSINRILSCPFYEGQISKNYMNSLQKVSDYVLTLKTNYQSVLVDLLNELKQESSQIYSLQLQVDGEIYEQHD